MCVEFFSAELKSSVDLEMVISDFLFLKFNFTLLVSLEWMNVESLSAIWEWIMLNIKVIKKSIFSCLPNVSYAFWPDVIALSGDFFGRLLGDFRQHKIWSKWKYKIYRITCRFYWFLKKVNWFLIIFCLFERITIISYNIIDG